MGGYEGRWRTRRSIRLDDVPKVGWIILCCTSLTNDEDQAVQPNGFCRSYLRE